MLGLREIVSAIPENITNLKIEVNKYACLLFCQIASKQGIRTEAICPVRLCALELSFGLALRFYRLEKGLKKSNHFNKVLPFNTKKFVIKWAPQTIFKRRGVNNTRWGVKDINEDIDRTLPFLGFEWLRWCLDNLFPSFLDSLSIKGKDIWWSFWIIWIIISIISHWYIHTPQTHAIQVLGIQLQDICFILKLIILGHTEPFAPTKLFSKLIS